MQPSMQRSIVKLLAAVLLLSACDEWRRAPAGASSAPAPAASASASGDDDLLPAIEVKSPRPRYNLAALSDKQLEKLITRTGWTPTVVGKTPPSDDQSTIRVGALRKGSGQQLEAAVILRCRKQGEPAASFPPGEAFFRDGTCI